MLSPVDPKFFGQFSVDPTAFFGKFAEFQRASIGAVSEMLENTSRGLAQLTSVRDPQDFFAAQQSVLQEVAQQNLAVLTRLGQSLTGEVASSVSVGKGAPKKAA